MKIKKSNLIIVLIVAGLVLVSCTASPAEQKIPEPTPESVDPITLISEKELKSW